ncbi:hypothetical protein [Listeria phage LMTA-57]|uniref:Uncharacterized protein n=3 Tax=Pecentumvirus TaxID=1857844 RepID=A0A060AGC5_9CAUD|nr:hypothetical protein HH39_gp026 [Listeria phage LMSP-25]YP_009616129.1 hypothetical protein FDI77_gp026 [Listeria phage LMTA-34]YP_009793325.1 hypothetical protein QLX42_gp022 [Listeria phage LMTA-57]AIA64369.1 hypothetical protein [Listeria phage LMSP-25]AID16927.1 hypothetical protein [Listeria phage LMTA-34]AID17476.1 hypothetical protein [Listeria phage LMTA-57]
MEMNSRAVENMVIAIVQGVKSYNISVEMPLSTDSQDALREIVISTTNDLASHLDLDTNYLLINLLGEEQ